MAVYNEQEMHAHQEYNENLLYGRIQELEQKKATLQMQLAAVQADLRCTINAIKTKQMSLDSAKTSFHSVNGDASDSSKERVRNFQDKIDSLNREIAQLESKKVEQETEIADIEEQIREIDECIAQLRESMVETRAMMNDIIELIQETDGSFAESMAAAGKAIQDYIDRMKQIMESFDSKPLLSDIPLARDPRNPTNSPAIAERLFWDDLKNGDITYLEACEYFSNLGEDKTDAQRKALAEEMAKQYAKSPEMVKAINAFGNGGYALPVNPVEGGTLGEGWPNYSTLFNDDGSPKYHGGVDINGVPSGTSIASATSGTVKKIGYDGNGYGNYVVIELCDGTYIYYAHMLNPASVEVGNKVNPGDPIGQVGSTGKSTGPHLHVEIYTPKNDYNDHALEINPNPADYIPGLTT